MCVRLLAEPPAQRADWTSQGRVTQSIASCTYLSFREFLIKVLLSINFLSRTRFKTKKVVFGYDSTCTVSPDAPALSDSEYKIVADVPLGFDAARAECQKFGQHWDLAIFNYEREYVRIKDIITENCLDHFAFWIGYTEYNLEQKTVFGQGL